MANKKYISEKQRKIRIIIAALLAVVILSAVFITGGILYSKHLNSGASMRKTVALESDNYEVNNCMLTYFFLSDFYNTYNTYGSYFEYMGLDIYSPMNAQAYDEESSWFDYFADTTLNNVASYIYYAEAGLADGFKAENLQADIDKQIDNLKTTAEDSGLDFKTYLTNIFGTGIKESDVRDALELQLYANSFYEKVEKDFSDSLTDEDYEEYYANNTNALNKVDYRSYTISAEIAEGADEATTNAAQAEAKAEAELLQTAATSVEGFTAWVSAHLTEANSELETPLSADEIKEKAEAVTEAAAYSEGSDLSTWAFAADRAVGDVTLIDDGTGNYTVYMMEKTAYRIEDVTKNVRHILLSADTYGSDEDAAAKADELLATYQTGEQGEDAFDAIAKEYNEDSSSLYENVAKGQMVAEFENWIYDDARVAGDTDIVKTEYGYHIMYFVGDGKAQWKLDAYNSLLESYITDLVEGFQESYNIDADYNAIAGLPTTIPTTAFQNNGTAVEESTAAAAEETAEIE